MKHIEIRRFTVLALCAAMLSASIQTVAASEEKTLLPADEHETAAALSEINILRGDGVSFNLDQIPDRLQASVMVVRMRGEEEEALAAYAAGETTNPFSDVPEDWAQPYVAWLYAKGIALGVGDGRFGRTDCTPEMYATFMLRALGYSDTAASPDFSYDTSFAYAKEKGICTAAMETDVFDRGTMASMTYLTLAADVAGDDTSLLSALIDDGAVKREDAKHLLEAFGETADAALPHVDLYGETVPHMLCRACCAAQTVLRKPCRAKRAAQTVPHKPCRTNRAAHAVPR